MKNLDLAQAKKIVNWYEETGKNNWGSWNNHPIAGRYLSYDTCHLQITLKEGYSFKGNDFNTITDGSYPVSKHNGFISVFEIKLFLQESRIEFVNNLTKDYYLEKHNSQIENQKRVILEFEEIHTSIKIQFEKAKKQVDNGMKYLSIPKVPGNPCEKNVTNYPVTIKNYCGEIEMTLHVDAVLKGKNARNNMGYYTVTSYNEKEYDEMLNVFANEHVKKNKDMLEYHKNKLLEIISDINL